MTVSDFLSPPLRVTVVCPTGQIGGAERWLFRLLEATVRLEVTAVVLGEGPLAQEWHSRGVTVTTIDVGRGPRAMLSTAQRLRRTLLNLDSDVILANGGRAGLAALPAILLDGCPLVWAKHDHAFEGLLTRELGRWSNAVVAPSLSVGRSGTGKEPTVVQPPRPIDAPWGSKRARAELVRRIEGAGGSIPASAPLALAVGSRIPRKGLSDAVSAIAASAPWQLVIIGEDDPASPGHGDELVSAARRLGVLDRVHLIGPVAEASQLMPGADALLQLTRRNGPGPEKEGYGMTVLEAACAGVPVICTPCPAAEELSDNGAREGVRLVPPAHIGSLILALAQLDDCHLRREAGAVAKAAGAGHPGTDELADRLVSTLAACAGRAGAGVPVERGRPVSVVAPLFTEGPQVRDLVDAVSRQLRAGDEFVAVDDASPDNTAEQVRIAADAAGVSVHLVRRSVNGGVGAARNSGVAVARHDLLVFADAGTTPAPGWLDAMRAAAASTPAPDMIAGNYAVSRRDPWQSAVAAACYPNPHPSQERRTWRRVWHSIFGLRLEASAPAGRSMAIARSGWEAIGGFDERRRAAEDVDAGQAVAAGGGLCVLATDALVTWDQAPTWRGTAAMYRHYGRGDAQADHHRAIVRDVTRALAYPLASLALLPGPAARVRRLIVGIAALTYASVPLARAYAQPQPHRVIPLVPFALALKDVAKAWGALGVITRWDR